jgi:hypothetical protein
MFENSEVIMVISSKPSVAGDILKSQDAIEMIYRGQIANKLQELSNLLVKVGNYAEIYGFCKQNIIDKNEFNVVMLGVRDCLYESKLVNKVSLESIKVDFYKILNAIDNARKEYKNALLVQQEVLAMSTAGKDYWHAYFTYQQYSTSSSQFNLSMQQHVQTNGIKYYSEDSQSAEDLEECELLDECLDAVQRIREHVA